MVVRELDTLGLAYLHVLEGQDPEFTAVLCALWSGPFLLNPATPQSRTGPDHLELIDNGDTDLVSFGQLFIANPDLPYRFAHRVEIAVPDMSTAYGGDHRGYTDYPTSEDHALERAV